MSSPTTSYLPYTSKRHSTQSSIVSLSQVQSSSGSSSSSTTPQPPYTQHTRTGSTASLNNGYSARPEGHVKRDSWLKSPQPQRFSRPSLVNNWNSSSNSTATTTTTTSYQLSKSPVPPPTTTGGMISPPPPPSPVPPNTLPFSPSPRPPVSPSPSTTPHSSPTKQPYHVRTQSQSTMTRPTNLGQTPMPYIQSFQPQGVRRDRTEEFSKVRKGKRREKLGEEERLERRLDKLLELHFPTTTTPSSTSSAPISTPPPSSPSLPSLNSLTAKSAKSFFLQSVSNLSSSSGVVNFVSSNGTIGLGGGGESIEKEEQKLVKWQEDRLVKECSICSASFGLLTRKHHCRLCGQIVCFLPPTPPTPHPSVPLSAATKPSSVDPGSPAKPTAPQRKERCSTFFTYVNDSSSTTSDNPRKGTNNTVEEKSTNPNRRRKGFIVEIPPIEQDSTASSIAAFEGMMMGNSPNGKGSLAKGKVGEREKEKDERKKVRVCRDCINIVLRHQFSTQPLETPNWLKLYRVLIKLETEIDQLLVEFQELALQLQQNQSEASLTTQDGPRPPPPSINQTASLRARLLTNLASYDTLSKRLLSLSNTSTGSSSSTKSVSAVAVAGGSELERLQKALGIRSVNWLSEKLSLLRSLGSIEEISGKAKKKTATGDTQSGSGGGNGGEGGIRSLESLLSQEELRKVREKVGEVGGGSGNGSGVLIREGDGAGGDTGQLGVLLEQEKLVQSYLEDANSRRQFEDAASLQASLNELRGEIERLRVG